jgi:urea carboxylase
MLLMMVKPCIPEGGCAVESHMPGSIWKIECASGDIVEEGATLQ